MSFAKDADVSGEGNAADASLVDAGSANIGAEVNVWGGKGPIASGDSGRTESLLFVSVAGGGEGEGTDTGAANVIAESAFGVGIRPPANRNASSLTSSASILVSSTRGGGG